jgi:hypothetical protein
VASRLGFIATIFVNASILGLILAALYATYFEEPGERQLGWGLLWLFGLPGTAAVSIFCTAFYRVYLDIEKLTLRVALYLVLVVLTSAAGPILSVAALRIWQWAAA